LSRGQEQADKLFAIDAARLRRVYTKLTLDPRVLSAAERETVWVALLVAAREEHGTIHLRRAGLRA